MVNKNILKKAMVFYLFFWLISCTNVINPKERNKLVFIDDLNMVVDSINQMNKLVTKMNQEYFSWTVTPSGEFYINSTNVGYITDDSLINKKEYNYLENNEKIIFINLVKFLSKNYITKCDKESGRIMYMYRTNIYMADKQVDLFRYIIVAKNEKDIDTRIYKILDRKENLFLLSDTNAKIWETKE